MSKSRRGEVVSMRHSTYQKTCCKCGQFSWHQKYESKSYHQQDGVKHLDIMTVVKCSICDRVVLFTVEEGGHKDSSANG